MRDRRPRGRWTVARALLATLLLATAGCEHGAVQSIMHPRGQGAEQVVQLAWLLFVLGGLVYLVVLALLGWSLMRRDRGDEPRRAPVSLWLGLGGALIPLLILLVVAGFTLATMRGEAHAERTETELEIAVIGHRWWWQIEYEHPVADRRFRTANEIHVPVGVPVRVRLESRDLIHSFWVPNLQSKTDMIPGRTNTLWLRADVPGVYRGQCAEFCGVQHANMALMVVAVPREEFDAWYERQLEPGAEPPTEEAAAGRDVFLRRDCALCHTVRGTLALGTAGPDLTHIGSRLTLAAGTLANNRGNLGGWLSDPQSIKPGNHMPPIDLSGQELRALIAYLESLQ